MYICMCIYKYIYIDIYISIYLYIYIYILIHFAVVRDKFSYILFLCQLTVFIRYIILTKQIHLIASMKNTCISFQTRLQDIQGRIE